jgi:hypothetical protein
MESVRCTDNRLDFIKENMSLHLKKIREDFMAEMAFDLDLEFKEESLG